MVMPLYNVGGHASYENPGSPQPKYRIARTSGRWMASYWFGLEWA